MSSNENKGWWSELKEGDVFCQCSYYKVAKDVRSGDGSVRVENQNGKMLEIGLGVVSGGNFHSASYVEKTENGLGKAAMAEKMTAVGDSVFTVEFHKQASEADVVEAAKEPDVKKRSAKVRAAMKGQKRTLRGHIIPGSLQSGRVGVIDMDADKKNNVRQVDLRTIEQLINRGVRYTTKK